MRGDSLERRDLLKLAAGACLVGPETACGVTPRREPASVADVAARIDPVAADALLAKIDKRMAWINEASLPEDVLPLSKLSGRPGFDRELADAGALVRKAVRTLYLTGRFLDMPDLMKAHPGVQSRLKAMQPEMDDAVLGMTERLERMTPDDHRRVQAHLKADNLFGDRLAHLLERTAADDGLSFQRTFGVRATTLQATERMSAQSPSLVTDPLVDKVRRIQAHPRPDAEQARLLAARVGEEVFWAHQERMALLHDAWAMRLGVAGAVASTGDDPVGVTAAGTLDGGAPPQGVTVAAAAPTPSISTPGTRTIGVGGTVMGFGAGSVVIGLIFAGIAEATSTSALFIPALVFGATVGPILLVVGLIILITGAVIRASE